MSLSTIIRGLVRDTAAPTYPSAEEKPVGINNRGELLVAQGLPERTELVRLGGSVGAQIPTASAFTYVNAWPTTRAELVLFNGEKAGGKTFVIDRAWMVGITSMAAAQPAAILAQLVPAGPAPLTAPSDNTAVLRHVLSGNKAYGGNALLALASTAFAIANKWFILGSGIMAPMTTNLGANVEANVFGKYLVPPGAAFCLAGLAGTAAGTAILGVEWHEVQLQLS